MESLRNSRFGKKVSENSTKLFESADYSKITLSNTYDSYVFNVETSFEELVKLFRKLQLSIDIIEKLNIDSFMVDEKYNKYEYIIYLLENFIIRLLSIEDRSLNLINIIFDLGNDDRNCKEHIILKNKNVIDSDVNLSYKKLSKILTMYKEDRNTIIHHGSYSNDDTFYLELYNSFLATGNLYSNNDDQVKTLNNFYSAESREIKDIKVKEFNDVLKKIGEVILEVFNHLEQRYDCHINKLKNYISN